MSAIQNTLLAQNAYSYLDQFVGSVAGNYLEIGSFNGDLVSRLAKKYPTKIFHCVDPFVEDGSTSGYTATPKGMPIPGLFDMFKSNVAGLENVRLYHETSKHFYSQHPFSFLSSLNVGAVFIDGDHRYDHVINDIYLAMDLLRGHGAGLMYLDDTHTKDVISAVMFFDQNFGSLIDKMITVGRGGMAFNLKAF